MEPDVVAWEGIARLDVQNTRGGGKQEEHDLVEGTVPDITERKEEFGTTHGVEKEKTARKDNRTDFYVADINKRKAHGDECLNKGERGSENATGQKRVRRTNR